MKLSALALLLLLTFESTSAQQFDFSAAADDDQLSADALVDLAQQVIAEYDDGSASIDMSDLARLQIAAQEYDDAVATIRLLVEVKWRSDSLVHVPVWRGISD